MKLSVKSRQDNYFENQRFGDSSSSQNSKSLICLESSNFEKKWKTLNSEILNFDCFLMSLGEGSSARFYVGHSIYKGKAALTIEPRAPEFVALEVSLFLEDQKLYIVLYL